MPLSQLTSKNVPFKWTDVKQATFDEIKKMICKEVLLACLDFMKEFEIHTNASHMQLSAVISQNGKPIAFYTCKLNPAQTRYTTIERELLSVVEMLKEFNSILLGQQIVVWMDHKT